jgi:Sulfotransferase family
MSMSLIRKTQPATVPLLHGHSFFVSVHIPKTAGTTLGNILDRVHRKRVLMDYPDAVATADPDPLIVAHADFVKNYFNGIHGHFNVRRHLPVFPSAKFIATVRHPVERVISQYLHEMNDDGADSAFHAAIRAGMTVVDFAGQAGIGDAMTRFLTGLDLRDYDLLLVSERLADSLHVLNYVVGNLDIPQHFGSPPVLPVDNRAAARVRNVVFDAATKSAIFARIGADIDTYRQAQALLAAKARRYLR